MNGFAFRQTITCKYDPKDLSGASPKFACLIGKDDEVKVKFGGTNAEVYAEVASTRLLWAHAGMSSSAATVGRLLDRYPMLWVELALRTDVAPGGNHADPSQFVGAVRNREDGHLDPSGVTHAFAKAARVVKLELVNNRVICNAMEPRA